MDRVHEFETSGDAYDCSQMGVTWTNTGDTGDTAVKDGDILHVPAEQVVGVCDTWPVAVTKTMGSLHGTDNVRGMLADPLTGVSARQLRRAVYFARERGYELAPWVADWLPGVTGC